MEELVIEGCAGILMERAINMQGGLAALLAYLRGEAIEGLQELDLTPRAATQAAVVEPLPRPAGSLCLGGSSYKTHRAGGGRREGLGCGQARMTAVPEGVGRLPSLTTVKIGLHSIRSEGASTLAKLQRLTALDVKGNSIGAKGAAALAKLVRLTTLDVEDNSIGVEGAMALAELMSLTTLDIGFNSIGAEGAVALAKLWHLTTLKVEGITRQYSASSCPESSSTTRCRRPGPSSTRRGEAARAAMARDCCRPAAWVA